MTRNTLKRPEQPTESAQRRSTDALWFAVLFVSIATGLGMTIFAPVGDAPPAAPGVGASSTTLPVLPLVSTTTTTTQASTSPATNPTP